MASFTAFLEVGGTSYSLYRYEFGVHQETDALGRPASPVLGGTITCTLSPPNGSDSFLYQWMLSPTMQQDGKVRLLQAGAKATEKTISFFNAYCTSLDMSFMPGLVGGINSNGTPAGLIQIQINPQRVAIGAIIHDNNWPLESHGAGESFTQKRNEHPTAPPKKEEEPNAFMEGLHSVLDVVGMIPVIGEAADLVNAGLYASEGRYAEAALSAASAIPVVGNIVGATKIGRRALKVADKVGSLSALASKGAKKADKALDAVDGPLKKLRKTCGDPVDVATGEVLAETVDFSLPGPIPLHWERTWYSSATWQGATGYGWAHAYEWAIIALSVDGTVGIRDGEGRLVVFEAPTPGGAGIQSERLALFLDERRQYRIWHMDERLWYVFGTATSDQESPQPLQAIESPDGFAVRFTYSEYGHLKTITDSAHRILRVDSNAAGQIIAIYSPAADGETSFPLIRYQYDTWGNLTTALDAEDQPMYYRYEGRQLVQRTARMGSRWHFAYENAQPGARCIHTWGDNGLLDYTLRYDSDTQTTVLDSYQQPTVYTHQGGLVTQQIDALDGEQRWTYSETKQLLAYQDALGRTTRYSYDDQDRLLQLTMMDGSTVSHRYDERGLLAEVTDARGERWGWTYNERGHLLNRTNPLGHVTHYSYDELGRLNSVTDALKQTTYLRYDEQHNVAHLVTPDEQIHSRGYDNLGRLITVTDPSGAVQRRTYDRLGQLRQVEEADGTTRQLIYDPSGNVVNARQDDQEVEFSYSGLGQMVSRRQAGQEIRFEYDKEGRLTGLVNEAGLRYRFGLDPLGQVVEEEGFDGLLRRYERDAMGRVTCLLRPAGRSTEYMYTPDGQVAQIRYSDGTQEVFAYDEAGALLKAQNNTTIVRLDRDALGQVIREEQGDQWVEYDYDAIGQRTAMRSSQGAAIDLRHDVLGNVATIQVGSWQASFAYDGRGLEVQRTFSGGVRIGWQRDRLGRPTQQLIGEGRGRQYTWRSSDQLAELTDSRYGRDAFEYDVFGTLTKAHYADGSQELRLPDAVGNLFETPTQTDRQYGPGGQLLSSPQGVYAYDAEGNLIRKSTPQGELWHYQWAGNGTLTHVTRPDGAQVSFGYDALGRRVSKHYKGKSTYWVWHGDVPLHEWQTFSLDGTNTDEVITWLFEEDSFAPVARLQGALRQSIVTDHLGTPLEMVDQGGQRTWAAQITAYGRLRMDQGTRQDCPFRFQGQYEDVETGLYYNRFRYYSPREGFYISQDPIGLKGGLATYSYVHNSNTWVDPFGLTPFYRGTRKGQPISFEPREPKFDAKGKQISGDYQIDKNTSLVKNTHGVSVFDNPESIRSRGFEPHKLDPNTVSDKLTIRQRGQDPRHFEIMPKDPMSVDSYKAELNKIKTKVSCP